MRWLIGCVAAVALLSVLQLAPGSRPPPQHLAELVPWRPTLAMRFSGQMAAMNEPLVNECGPNTRKKFGNPGTANPRYAW